MGSIRATSATVATLYITFLAFVILCVYNFTPITGRFNIQNFNYGIAFLLLSACGLLSGFTSGDVDDPFLRAFLVCLSAMWGALGTYYVTRDLPGPYAFLLGLPPKPSSPPEALFPGYFAFFFIFLIFGFSCIQHQSYFTSVLSLGLFLCCIFEIAALWRQVRMSVGAYYLLLGALVIYMVAKILVDKLRGIDHKRLTKRLPMDNDQSNDYMAVGYAMDVVAFAVFASHVTGATTIASNGFMWVGSAGIFQTVCGVVAIRRKDPYCGGFFTLYGVFWCAVAFNLGLNHFSAYYDLPLLAVNIFFVVVFFLSSMVSLTRELFHSMQNILLAIFTIAICVDGVKGRFLGGMGWVCFLFSLYGLAAHTGRLKPTRYKLPLGRRLFDRAQLKQSLTTRLSCCARCIYGNRKENRKTTAADDGLFSTDFSDMGYSKYIDLDMIGFAVNAVSSLSVLWIPADFTLLTLPWVSIVGGAAQMTVGCISFARGLTFESCSFIVFSTMWLILGTARSLGVVALDNSVAMGIGSITYMITGLLLIGLSLVISKAWFLVTFLFELVALAFLLNSLAVPSYNAYEIIVVLLFTLVCLYCFLASAFKSIWGRELLPTGSPIIQVSYLHSQGNRALWAHAQKQTGVKAIAGIMNKGGIAGIPTDTVYVLTAAVKFPHAVERAYQTKKLAEDRPMSMWISNVNQLAAGREQFGEMLWDFMNAVWPSTISCVVNKGPWLDSLGIGSASKYVGRPDSIAVRMPDNTVTSFLIDHTGPLAVTSANPTGEADTTHHLQVLAKLGLKNCDGILCDGPSFANSASTVVDCRKINDGQIGFFRIGLVPKSRVEEIFERIQAKHKGVKSISRHLSKQSISETLDSGVCDRDPGDEGHINAGFEDEIDDVTGDENGHRFGGSNGDLEESQIRPYVSSNLSHFKDSRSINAKTSLANTELEKQSFTIESELNRAETSLQDERINHLIQNLEKLLHDSTGNKHGSSDEPEIQELIAKLQKKPRDVNKLDLHAAHYENDHHYEKMNFGGNITPVDRNDLNKVLSIMDSSDGGSDEPLTSLRSRRRRELQEEINKFVLSRGEKKGTSEIVTDLNESPNGMYTTTLEVNVDQDGHTRPNNPFPELQSDTSVVMASKQKSTPLLENIISFQEQKDRGVQPRKVLHPPIGILGNDAAFIEVENAEKSRRDPIGKGSNSGWPSNQDGDNVRSFEITDKIGPRVSDRPKLPTPPSPLFERLESHTQLTHL